NPAKLYGLDAGYLAENGPADLVIFDPTVNRQVSATFASKSANSPFVGDWLMGQVRYTIADGQVVFEK
ncbi:TPA: amidohydrolase family protein, partial [Streptococcus suis]